MREMTAFERRLSDRLATELDATVGGFDPALVAAAAIVRRDIRDHVSNRLGLGALPMSTRSRAGTLVLVAALLTIAAAAVALLVAGRGGGTLAFITTSGDVTVAAGDGSNPRVIAHVPSPVLFTQLEWAPGGRHLAVVDEDAQLTIFTASGEVASQRPLDIGNARFEWSPDGQELAILDGPWLASRDTNCSPPLVHPHLEVITPEGKLIAQALPTLPDGFRFTAGIGELTWSPDGRRLAIAGSVDACIDEAIPSSIWLVDLDQAAVRELTPGGPDQFDFQPVWLPDGRLLFSRSDTGIMSIDPATGATSVVLDAGGVCEGCENGLIRIEDVSPDGTRLVLKHSTAGSVVLDLRTGVATVVRGERQGAGLTSPILWTPDGRSILIDFAPAFDARPDIVAVDVPTGRMRVVVPGARFFAVVD